VASWFKEVTLLKVGPLQHIQEKTGNKFGVPKYCILYCDNTNFRSLAVITQTSKFSPYDVRSIVFGQSIVNQKGSTINIFILVTSALHLHKTKINIQDQELNSNHQN
jgi:hypothetical protein